ncbi:helix-turn-helix transcriptional regulator, partial [Kineococcus glutinatus]|uniref:helix-turn-helix transcriptional regulator n=1 Tax=Kineococcus glutinatus TaxID=1070872 RepID=UPI0031EEE54C
HVSPFHFARLFRVATGCSPHQHVLRRRVERARELVVGTAVPLAQVAARCGFADQSHLTRALRRELGVTPAALRARS